MWDFFTQLQATDENEFDKMLALLSWSAGDGPPKNREKCNPVGDGVFEFKTKRVRICWFYDAGQLIICTHGFLKGKPKAQDREIASAKKIKREYFEQKKIGATIQLRKRGEK